MRRVLCSSTAAVAVVALIGGCFTTKIAVPQASPGPRYEDRQWFTIGGLVPLSPAAGQQCTSGLARAESEFAAVDVLIYIGIALAGGLGGALACSGDASTQASCISIGSSLVPFLIASRTVTYDCLGSERTAQELDPSRMFPAADAK